MTEQPSSRLQAIPGLLDEGLLGGQHEATTTLRPERSVQVVSAGDLEGQRAEMELACQIWGGGSRPIVPLVGTTLPVPYVRLLETEQIDLVSGVEETDVSLPERVESRRSWDIPALLVAASEPLERWRPVQVVELGDDDPWREIYNAVLGTWPEVPDPGMIKRSFLLREDLRFEEVVPVERVTANGSLEDLIARTTDEEHLTPRQVANMFLNYGLRPDTSFMGVREEVVPNPYAKRRSAGPNVIVVVTQGSVEDLALLWNLRGAHGLSRTLPIGVPVEQVTAAVLRELQEPGRATMFGLGGGACHLVSASVPLSKLWELAELSKAVVASPYEELVTFGPAPGRVRSHVSWWQDGKTRLDPMANADRDVLRVARDAPNLVLDVAVNGYPLPTDPTMRGTDLYGRFQAGEAQLSVSSLRAEHTVEVRWPSSWTCLAAVAQSRGLSASASEPGLAAATLIRALGSVQAVEHLLHQPLIDLLYRMAEQSGMSWWKKRWATTHRQMLEGGADTATLEEMALRLGRDEPAVGPPGEGRTVPFQEFVVALGGDRAARHWVGWAERRHLVVRGAEVTCPGCRTVSWLPLAALPPPVPCPGCGRQIDQPYDPRELRFTYRLGEPLRRVLETDSLGHVLVLRWVSELFERGGLVGAHPGVTFAGADGQLIGEADVLLLFSDGSLVPIEVKRRGAGVDERALSLMDTLADALEARWDALAVTQAARDLPDIAAAERRSPDRPRLLLTDDQIHEPLVIWTMGSNPFEWAPRTADQDRERERAYRKALAGNDPDVPWDRVADTLLNPAIRARRRPAASDPSGTTSSTEENPG